MWLRFIDEFNGQADFCRGDNYVWEDCFSDYCITSSGNNKQFVKRKFGERINNYSDSFRVCVICAFGNNTVIVGEYR